MAVSTKHILQQGPVIAGLGKSAIAAAMQRFSKPSASPLVVPSEVVQETLPPRPSSLIKDYIRNVGGDPKSYKGVVPPHLFPQWGFPLSMETLKGIPYPMMKVMNGGCRLEVNAPLPVDEPLQVSAQLVDVDDNGRRAVLHQRSVTGTPSSPDAVVGHLYAIVPLGGGDGAKPKRSGAPKKRPQVPVDAKEIAFWRLGPKAGLDFAKLTGDFNPVHWVPPYARAFGFKNVILHGFSTMARAIEGLNRHVFMGRTPIRLFDVKFTKPLVLPARVGLYLRDSEIYVGDAPGGPAYMVGSFETEAAEA